METARTEPELGMLWPNHRIQMNPQWNQGGPRPGTAFHAGGSTAHDALPFILAMARRHEEQEFQRGATRMAELLEDNMSAPRHATTHTLGDRRKAASNRAATELDATIGASLGRPSALQTCSTPINGSLPPSPETLLK